MEDPRERDLFARIEQVSKIEKARLMILQYEQGLAHQRGLIEKHKYEIGRLDERLEVEG